jgi:hypothetical protein
MLSLHILRAPYMVPTKSWVDWSLPGHFLFTTWSVHGPFLVLPGLYAVPTLSVCSQYGPYMVPIQPAWSQHGSYSVLVPTWSIPDQYLVHTWSICGLYVVPSWSCMVLTWFLCVPYMLLHGLFGLYMVPT